ncbi:MAG: hypothetical protein P1V51_16550 [Deltaproteobacteria bacterium]|nr:hypothetical protein [Deltaproteobacteria bacterium]
MKLLQGIFAALALLALLLVSSPARAQMERPEWVEDVKWHATVGTGMAAETGGAHYPEPVTGREHYDDPLLLYFGGNVKKSWRWWYGLTFKAKVDLYTGITEYPMMPYKLGSEAYLGMGAPMFQIAVARAELISEFDGVCQSGCTGYPTGTIVRLQASTLPTFTGDVTLADGKHILTYLGVPLQIVFGRYSTMVQPNADDYNWNPYTGGQIRLQDVMILTDWAQLHGGVTFHKAYSNPEYRLVFDIGVAVGIMQNAVQFGLDIVDDQWRTPGGLSMNTATFTLSARLKI